MSPERKLDSFTAQWAIQALARLMLTVAVVMGLLIVVGGDARFSGASYATALRYPYAPESWGVILAFAGFTGLIGSLAGRLRIVAAGLFVMSVWCLFFAHSLIKTAIENPVAGTTGPVVYAGCAVFSVVLGLVHWKSATR